MTVEKSCSAFVGRAVLLEMEIFLSAICGHFGEKELPEHLGAVIDRVPKGLVDSLQEILQGRRRLFSFLGFAAMLADTLVSDDYDASAMTVRSLTVTEALQKLRQRTAVLDLRVERQEPAQRELAILLVETQKQLFQRLGGEMSLRRVRMFQDDAELAISILAGQQRHQRFWMLLDRLYYQYWEPFRQEQQDKMLLIEGSVREALHKEGFSLEALSWLPNHNPLRSKPEFLKGIKQAGLDIFFWSEPIGLPDSWFATPEMFCVSFAESGQVLESFHRFAEDIATRLNALSDPTRLVILRLIREFGMYNTEIASFLGLARPTVSNHAKILREAGLITTHRENGKAFHQLCEQEVSSLFADLQHFLDPDS